jgi:predicted kinase
VPFAIVSCTAPREELARRIRERERRGDDPSEAGLEVLAAQSEAAEGLAGEEREQAMEVDTRCDDAVASTMAWLPIEPAGSAVDAED